MDTQDPEHLVESPIEIAHLLRAMQERRSMVLVQAADDAVHLLTMVLEVDEGEGALVLDAPSDHSLISRALASNGILQCECRLDNVFVSFEIDAHLGRFEGRPALRAALPGAMIRLQRRDSFRMQIPPTQDARADLRARGTFPALDISSTGLALGDTHQGLDVAPDSIYSATLNLPDIGTLEVKLRIVHHYEDPLARGGEQSSRHMRRVGCQYLDMHESISIRIQSYVFALQRAQIARERDFDDM